MRSMWERNFKSRDVCLLNVNPSFMRGPTAADWLLRRRGDQWRSAGANAPRHHLRQHEHREPQGAPLRFVPSAGSDSFGELQAHGQTVPAIRKNLNAIS